jgi:hypothetical protein
MLTNYFHIYCGCDGYFTIKTKKHVKCDKCGKKRNIEDYNDEETSLADEISTAKDSDILKLLKNHDESKQIHSTHPCLY